MDKKLSKRAKVKTKKNPETGKKEKAYVSESKPGKVLEYLGKKPSKDKVERVRQRIQFIKNIRDNPKSKSLKKVVKDRGFYNKIVGKGKKKKKKKKKSSYEYISKHLSKRSSSPYFYMEHLYNLAQDGDLDSRYKLGITLRFGLKGVRQDIDKGMQQLLIAAERGHVRSQVELYSIYNSEGNEEEEEE